MQYQDLSLKKLQVAAFDWDNTLAYSREALVFAINKVLPRYNLPEWDIIQHKRNRVLAHMDFTQTAQVLYPQNRRNRREK